MKINEKVIISLTTISSRIAQINMVLNHLLKQDYENFEIRVHISKDSYLLDKGILDIDDNVLCDPKIKYIFVKNTGPYRKLIPVLNEFWGTHQAIVTVDDDVIYPSNLLSTLLVANQIFDCPIAFRGRKIKFDKTTILPYNQWQKTELSSCSISNLPTGKDGIFYRPSYFHKDVLDIDKAVELAPTTDDLWFKWYTVLNEKPSVLLFNSLADSFDVANETNETLFDSFNKHTNNDQVIQNLEEYFKHKYSKTMLINIHNGEDNG